MINAVTYILEHDSTVQGLVGLNAVGDKHKVYPVIAPQSETAPYIAVRVNGRVRAAKGCAWTWGIIIACYAISYDEASALNEAVINALEGAQGGTINSEDFSFLNQVNEADDFVNEHKLYAKVTTFEGM